MPRCFPGRPGRAILAETPTSWERRSALTSIPYTIVGVTPEGFYGTEKFSQPDIFIPMANEASLEGVDWLE